jgi:Tfp pilus assembly protein PilF
LAKAYFQQGDKVKAQTECRTALQCNPAQYEKNQIQDLLQKTQ